MPTLGETLRDARATKKAKLGQVEAETRIARATLEALETDRLEVLPDDVYTRGAIRNYALYLDLDADQTLALYRSARPAQIVARPLSQVTTVTRLTPLTYAMISALVGILVVVALFVTHII
ncbi:MAG TPA: helix-turn-helix domain-containing protein [Chloroflexota bacterium]|nr:helix-turn-helix domain-containing protein [Chloroflexota bacterium]